MRSLITLTMSSIFTLPMVSVAEDRGPTDFTMEFIVPAGTRSEGSIDILCLEGCDWTRRSFACPQSPEECRARVSGRSSSDVGNAKMPEPAVYPVLGTVCLGVNVLADPPGTLVQKCETYDRPGESGTTCRSEEMPNPKSRAYIHDVIKGSAAEQAGLSPPDVLLRFNDRVIQRGADLQNEVRQLDAGQPFEALIERDGKQMTLYGRLGIRMSDGGCVAATEQVLAAATAEKPPPPLAPFKLIIRVPGSHADYSCIDGCGWPSGGTGDVGGSGGPDGLVFGLQQDHDSLHLLPVGPDQSPFERGN